jgi:serine/threonine protein kinase
MGVAGLEFQSIDQALLGQRYTIIRRLGRGGHAIVYLVDDHATGLQRACKIARRISVAAELTHDAAVGMRVAGPGVPVLCDSGILSDGRPYFVSEYVAGRTVDELVARGRPPLLHGLLIARAVARTLARCHSLSIIHRDVKPRNIIVPDPCDSSAADRAQLIDFGIARPVVDKDIYWPARDLLGHQAGTHDYMAPEQLAGRRSTPRMDVYGLGASLFCMAYGRTPFVGGTIGRSVPPVHGMPNPFMGSFILKRLTEEISFPADIDVPLIVVNIIADATRVDPDARMQSCAEFVERLDDILRLVEPLSCSNDEVGQIHL